MLIQCTKKLLEQLNIKPKLVEEEKALFSWHANLILINQKKTVVLVNDKNKYVIVVYGLKAKDFINLDVHIKLAIKETFKDECIKDSIIDSFINCSREVTYTKTKNKSLIARVNKACEWAKIYADLLDKKSINQSTLSIRISDISIYKSTKYYVSPNKEMYKDLESFAAEHIFSCKAAIIKVTLDLENHEVWRRLVIPVNITFDKLHQILQIAFNWKDYHLHEFFIYDENKTNDKYLYHTASTKEGYEPIVNLVCDEESLGYKYDDIEVILEKGIKLSKYLPAMMKYIYDFGDSWYHFIEVEKIIDNYDKNFPNCIDGIGNAPPEDVGGESGFDEFLEIISDKNNPECEGMLSWGKSQGYVDFDIEKVNKRLKSSKSY